MFGTRLFAEDFDITGTDRGGLGGPQVFNFPKYGRIHSCVSPWSWAFGVALDMNALGREESKSGSAAAVLISGTESGKLAFAGRTERYLWRQECRSATHPQVEYAMRFRQRSPRQRDSRIGSRLR